MINQGTPPFTSGPRSRGIALLGIIVLVQLGPVWGQAQPAVTTNGQVSSGPTLRSRITIGADKGSCWFAIYSPDGKVVATGGDDGMIRFWDPSTGEPKGTLTGHTKALRTAAFSPDGKTLASGAINGEMFVWDVATRQWTAILTGHTQSVRNVAFAPDGKTLASCSDDRTIKIWDTASWNESIKLPGQTMPVKWLCFAPDSKTLATAAAANSPSEITLWEAGSDRVRRILNPRFYFWTIAFSPDSKTIAGAGVFHALKLIDVASGEERASLPVEANCRPVAFSPDGKLLATALYTGEVRLWDLLSSRQRWRLAEHKGQVFRVDFAPDGKSLASAGADGTAKIWDLVAIPPEPG